MKITKQSKRDGLESVITLEQAIEELEGGGHCEVGTVQKRFEEEKSCHTDEFAYFPY